METFKKHLLPDGVFRFAGVIGAQLKETRDWIGDGHIMLTFVERSWICGYVVPTLQASDW